MTKKSLASFFEKHWKLTLIIHNSSSKDDTFRTGNSGNCIDAECVIPNDTKQSNSTVSETNDVAFWREHLGTDAFGEDANATSIALPSQWHCVWLKPKTKDPSGGGEDWPVRATNDQTRIQKWIDREYNVGLLLGPKSGVIDIEGDSPEAFEILDELFRDFITPTYKSSRGVHRLFQYDDRFTQENKVVKVKPSNIEMRFGHDRLQSVLPPSTHETGIAYEWLPGLSPSECELARLPDAIWDHLCNLRNEYEKQHAPSLVKGTYEYREQGDYPAKVRDYVNDHYDFCEELESDGWKYIRSRGEARDFCRPGKERGVSATLNYGGCGRLVVFSSSVGLKIPPRREYPCPDLFAYLCETRYGDDFNEAAKALVPEDVRDEWRREQVDQEFQKLNQSNIRHFSEKYPLQEVQADTRTSDADAIDANYPCVTPDHLFKVPGFIGDVMQYTLDTMTNPNKATAFCGALTLQATLCGRKVCDRTGNRPNLTVICTADSTAGKDRPRRVNQEILDRAGMSRVLISKVNHEGLEDAIIEDPLLLALVDEVDSILRAMSSPKHNPDADQLMSTLMEMFTSSGTYYQTRTKAKHRGVVVRNPSLTIFATCLPENFYAAMSDKMLTNGFFGRTIVIESKGRSRTVDFNSRPIPESIIETAKWWHDFAPGGGNLSHANPIPIVVQRTSEAEDLGRQIASQMDDYYDSADAAGKSLWGRGTEKIGKLALVYAVSRSHHSPLIDVEALTWARDLVTYSAKRMLYMAAKHAGNDEFSAKCEKVLDMIINSPGRCIAHSKLLQRSKVSADQFSKIIRTLIEREQIISRLAATKGRPTREYVAV